jgi:hypothetical protein
MTAPDVTLSSPAKVQYMHVTKAEKNASAALFVSDQPHRARATVAIPEGRFVSPVLGKLVLWQWSDRRRPESLSIVRFYRSSISLVSRKLDECS